MGLRLRLYLSRANKMRRLSRVTKYCGWTRTTDLDTGCCLTPTDAKATYLGRLTKERSKQPFLGDKVLKMPQRRWRRSVRRLLPQVQRDTGKASWTLSGP